jgi:hypothetical protein
MEDLGSCSLSRRFLESPGRRHRPMRLHRLFRTGCIHLLAAAAQGRQMEQHLSVLLWQGFARDSGDMEVDIVLSWRKYRAGPDW